MRKIRFLKGHMGGNEIVLLNRENFSRAEELSKSLKILSKPHICGDQVGLLYPRQDEKDIFAKIVDINSNDYLPMCGGLTQVIGKAHMENELRHLLEYDPPTNHSTIQLSTDLGSFRISVNATRKEYPIITDMEIFINQVYEQGVKRVIVNGVQGFFVGDFLVLFTDKLRLLRKNSDLEPLDEETKKVLIEFQQAFSDKYLSGKPNRDFVIIEEGGSDSAGKLFFPHNLEEGLLESSCGTGTVAATIAMISKESIEGQTQLSLEFECGGRPDCIGGPDLIRMTGKVREGKLVEGSLSHNNVEILASGFIDI